MSFVVVDTDVASNLVKSRVPPALLAQLAPLVPCVTFVTLAELTEWRLVRQWGARSVGRLTAWITGVPVLGYDDEVAYTWGRLSAETRRAGRRAPVNDLWIAACCLVEDLPLATMNAADYAHLAEHHGLTLLTTPGGPTLTPS